MNRTLGTFVACLLASVAPAAATSDEALLRMTFPIDGNMSVLVNGFASTVRIARADVVGASSGELSLRYDAAATPVEIESDRSGVARLFGNGFVDAITRAEIDLAAAGAPLALALESTELNRITVGTPVFGIVQGIDVVQIAFELKFPEPFEVVEEEPSVELADPIVGTGGLLLCPRGFRGPGSRGAAVEGEPCSRTRPVYSGRLGASPLTVPLSSEVRQLLAGVGGDASTVADYATLRSVDVLIMMGLSPRQRRALEDIAEFDESDPNAEARAMQLADELFDGRPPTELYRSESLGGVEVGPFLTFVTMMQPDEFARPRAVELSMRAPAAEFSLTGGADADSVVPLRVLIPLLDILED